MLKIVSATRTGLKVKRNDNIYAPQISKNILLGGGRVEEFSIRFLMAYGMSLNLMFYDYDYYTICM